MITGKILMQDDMRGELQSIKEAWLQALVVQRVLANTGIQSDFVLRFSLNSAAKRVVPS